MERLTFEGQADMITGVHLGNGHGPKVLALLQDAAAADVIEKNAQEAT